MLRGRIRKEEQPTRTESALGVVSPNMAVKRKKKRSGIPTGNAGEYFVMGELLRRGFDAQLADRNTSGYDILVVNAKNDSVKKVQVKTSRSRHKWYVKVASFDGKNRNQITVYVYLGRHDKVDPVRFFIAENRKLKKFVHRPQKWRDNGFMPTKAVEKYENQWDYCRCT
jgi:hypothetical protein